MSKILGRDRIKHHKGDALQEGDIKDAEHQVQTQWQRSAERERVQRILKEEETAFRASRNIYALGLGSLAYNNERRHDKINQSLFENTAVQLSLVADFALHLRNAHSHSHIPSFLHNRAIEIHVHDPAHQVTDLNILNDRGITATKDDRDDPAKRIEATSIVIMPNIDMPAISPDLDTQQPTIIVTAVHDRSSGGTPIMAVLRRKYYPVFKFEPDEAHDPQTWYALYGTTIWVRKDICSA
ncbi:MAG: hypothetical protein Q9162_000283 [Coniocarpon cinnabarinum]